MVAEELVPDPVELIGGDTGHDVGADQLEGLRGESAGDPHPLDRLGVLDLLAREPLGRGRSTYSGRAMLGGTRRRAETRRGLEEVTAPSVGSAQERERILVLPGAPHGGREGRL